MKSSNKRSSIQPGRGRSAKSGYKAGKSSRTSSGTSRPKGSGRSFKNAESEDRPEKSPFAPAYRSRKSSDGDKPFKSKSSFDRDDKRRFSDGEKPVRRRSDDGGEKSSYSEKDKPFRSRTSSSRNFSRDERPNRRRSEEGSEGRERRDGVENKERRSFSKDNKPYKGRTGDERFGSRRSDGDKPVRRRSFDDAGEKREGDDRSSRSFSSKSRGEGKPESRFNREAKPEKGKARWFEGSEKKERPFRRDESSFQEKKWNRKESHQFYGDKKKKAGSKRPEFSAADEGATRLNKFIANAGICSRREADELIKAGVISVNGNIVTEMGFKVQPGDTVKYNNSVLRGEQLQYVLLNKPKDFITTTDDPDDRKTVMSLVGKACKERIYPVGRLDRNTTGVLLFTNDGDLAKKLTHPSFQVQKVYQVELDKNLKQGDFEAIENGLKLEDGFIKVDDIVYGQEKHILGVELHSGKNRIVRRIFEHLGYEVKKLDRVVFAGLTKKDLPRGRYRFLTEMEVANLKMQVGKKAAV